MSLYKRDARSEQAEKKFKQNLIALSETKPLKKITVAELCKLCKVNRGTFYNHYNDIEDIIEKIEDDLFEQVKSILNDIKVFSFDENFFRKVIEIIKNNLHIVQSVAKENFLQNDLLRKIYDFAKNKFISEFTEFVSDINVKETEDLFVYTFGGSIALFMSGIKDPNIIDQAARKADYYNKLIMQKFIADKNLKV